jgi:predicted Rossmann fold flavoprotein
MGGRFDVIVLGAGAAGLFCAAEVAKRGRRVALLERSEQPGKKILISGGGRCNFTNLHCRSEHFLSANPHFAKSALARFEPRDFIALVEKHRIPYHEKTLGQLFCDRAATDITGLLLGECRSGGVHLRVNQQVTEVLRTTEYLVRAGGDELRAPALVVATGGLSIPKMGATAFGYELARQFGLRIEPPRPALVPLVFAPREQREFGDLAGVSAEVIASAEGASFREKMLVTHRGLSGPAILQASSYWRPGREVRIDLAPGHEIVRAVRAGRSRTLSELHAALEGILPKRFRERWIALHPPESLTNAGLERFERSVHDWRVLPAGTEGYGKAEVTAGGVDTTELSGKTMESRRVRGLFFIGEVVDVTGHLGGFNFQWAWASAAAAARALSPAGLPV